MDSGAFQWVSVAVTFAAAVVVGYLARRSPQDDWEFVKSGAGYVLLAGGFGIAQAELAPAWIAPVYDFVCSGGDCEWVVTGGGFEQPEVDASPGGILWLLFGGTLTSMAFDLPAELLGGFIGVGIALVTGAAAPPADPGPGPTPIAEAAQRLGVTPETIRRRVHRGTIVGVHDRAGRLIGVRLPDDDDG